MLHDEHLHLRPHTIPPRPHELAPVLAEAKKRGITPAVREHPPLPLDFRIGPYGDYDYGMREEEVSRFVKLFSELNAPLGLESDFIQGYEDETESIIDEMLSHADREGVEISGVHGSIHLLPGTVPDVGYERKNKNIVMWDLDESVFIAHLKDRGVKRVVEDYFDAMMELVDSRMFDVLSHIDLLKKFDRKNSSGDSAYFSEVEDLFMARSRQVVEGLASVGMAIEINTAGFCNLIGRPYITQEILDYAVKCGVPVCFGSDAHLIERIGSGFDVAVQMLEKSGAGGAVFFKNRVPVKYEPSVPSSMNCCDKGCRE